MIGSRKQPRLRFVSVTVASPTSRDNNVSPKSFTKASNCRFTKVPVMMHRCTSRISSWNCTCSDADAWKKLISFGESNQFGESAIWNTNLVNLQNPESGWSHESDENSGKLQKATGNVGSLRGAVFSMILSATMCSLAGEFAKITFQEVLVA